MGYIPQRAFKGDDPARDAHHHRIVRNIFGDHAVGTNGNAVPNLHRSNNFRSGTDVDIVADRWIARSGTAACHTQCHALRNVTIFSNLAAWVNNDSTKMPNIKTGANFSEN